MRTAPIVRGVASGAARQALLEVAGGNRARAARPGNRRKPPEGLIFRLPGLSLRAAWRSVGPTSAWS